MNPTLVLAPVRGATDHIFRDVFHRHFGGVDYAVCPFVTTTRGARVKKSHLADISPGNNPRLPVVPQALGNDPGEFLLFARACAEMGYHEVNWNLGCPYPMVTKKKRGSGLLPYPDAIEAFLRAVVPESPCAVSVKIRLGLHNDNDCLRVIPVLNRCGVHALAIHARTASQMYGGKVNLERFAECLELSRAPVIYNGDIVTVDGFRGLQDAFPRVAAWMIGRGALINPFLPSMIRDGRRSYPPDASGRFAAFHRELCGRYREALHGPAHFLGKMKELWGYFSRNGEEGKKLFKKIRVAETIDEFYMLIGDNPLSFAG